MSFTVYDAKGGRPSNEMAITIDRAGRMYLNRKLQEELDCVDKPIKLLVAYEADTGRIGIARPEDVKVENYSPLSFGGERAYASARGFINRFNIDNRETLKYVFDEITPEGWMAFKLAED